MKMRLIAVMRPRIAVSISTGFIIALTILLCCLVEAAPVPVRFLEGVTHGFLLVRSVSGEVIGRGELTQVAKDDDLVESRLLFNFSDGSIHDEKVAFSQKRAFTLVSYHLVQRGPAFPEQLEVSIDRGTSKYEVRSKEAKDENEDVATGEVELPKDVYNGMLIMALLNLPRRASETVNVLAFTPKPEVIKLELVFKGESAVHIGDQPRKALRYSFVPGIGIIKKFFGKVLGKLPEGFHYDCWILDDEMPAFVQYQGPLQLMGPVLRIELVSPRLSTTSANEKNSSK